MTGCHNHHEGESHVNRWQLTSRCTAWVTSRLRQDKVNRHMCHMRMSLKGRTHFNTISNVWVITPHGATQNFGMRRLTPHCPFIIITRPHPPYTSSHPLLTILMLVKCLHDIPPTLITILTLAVPSQQASNTAYHTYTHSVPSQNSSYAPLTLA
ncbi:hypothetical protein O181_036136 [Austropuccinia psidii MF-1]|uniref:Uncharacterized protein n=1 Tax=Austropuccinia psidii MF-1 TaxID=1389203 RepID=A0A9Q3H9M7_9BASI|nr:hypothetical protein [Austropuccinia psidii MF-1]